MLIESYSQYEKEFTSPESWQTYLENITSSVDNVQIDRILVAKLGQSVSGTLQLFDGLTEREQHGQINRFSEEVIPVIKKEIPDMIWSHSVS
ncbi:hypothetical protein LIT32_15345 [Bacillus sp. CMF21]|uniref:hypothetical protein n=1 Tax=Metabacillus dongyingensis TaxID=2874282 RepID=UPI001FB3DE48|nr:hypothetical protein [Metabacillus dongyingensis]UOK56668.1 hypothetical protein MGI18_17765 [Bacillus sp. OVS6]USK26866.1 hypothetical protein LIT32_15345 [Bacillus sp. CMF21]